MSERNPSIGSEYLVGLAAVQEYEAALKYKKAYEDLTHAFVGLFKEFMRYCKTNGIEIPDQQTYERIVGNIQALILSRVASPEVKHPFKSPDYEAEPRHMSCSVA
jgi:hypothetical protein